MRTSVPTVLPATGLGVMAQICHSRMAPSQTVVASHPCVTSRSPVPRSVWPICTVVVALSPRHWELTCQLPRRSSCSRRQVAEQPSKSAVLPSSQSSSAERIPSTMQTGGRSVRRISMLHGRLEKGSVKQGLPLVSII